MPNMGAPRRLEAPRFLDDFGGSIRIEMNTSFPERRWSTIIFDAMLK
jgi:hypothetical protein